MSCMSILTWTSDIVYCFIISCSLDQGILNQMGFLHNEDKQSVPGLQKVHDLYQQMALISQSHD